MKKLLHAAAALGLIAAAAVTSVTPVEARGGRVAAGVVAGTLLGLGIAGAYANDRDYACYEGRRRCEVVGQRCHYNRWGEYVCRDDVRCWRPRHCD